MTPKSRLAVYSAWPRCSLVLVLQGLCRTPSGDINTFQHWPLFSSCWLGLRGKPCAWTGFLYHFCHATLLWSILRKFGRQLFLVVTEQAGVESQHFPPMMKNCYDIRKMSNFVWEGIFVSQAFYTGFQLSIVESAKAAALLQLYLVSVWPRLTLWRGLIEVRCYSNELKYSAITVTVKPPSWLVFVIQCRR